MPLGFSISPPANSAGKDDSPSVLAVSPKGWVRRTLPAFILLVLLTAATYHIVVGPFPTEWDDAVYATDTFRWLRFMRENGVVTGFLKGLYYFLPGHMPRWFT